MASKGAPKGNQNAKKENRLWADAIRIAIVSGKKLRPLAEKLIAKAEEGDMAAMREIGDRLDGKPSQDISTTTHQHHHVHVTVSESSKLITEALGVREEGTPKEPLH